jgi:spermidine/putrescine transport system ATP-binding protein
MSAGVELSNVSMDFGTFRAVDNVSIDIKPGEFFSFLGPSGCGKTTILRMISGFIDPVEGSVKIGGESMVGVRPNQRPTALIFQNLALFPLMPVWENIAFGLEVRGVDRAKRRETAERLLELVELPDSADKKIHQLSGGQKQRVAIARALAVEPKVMLLDEPLSALDLKLRQHMRAELRAIQKRTNVTFIYITHDQSEALAMSDRVGVMSQGRLQQVATPQEIYNAPVNGFVASFVGENNIFEGKLSGQRFESDEGAFQVRPGPDAKGDNLRMFVRPEHIHLATPGAAEVNGIAATVDDVAFEGNFINVRLRSKQGKVLVAELRNDGKTQVPERGAAMSVTFGQANAVVLAGDIVPGGGAHE